MIYDKIAKIDWYLNGCADPILRQAFTYIKESAEVQEFKAVDTADFRANQVEFTTHPKSEGRFEAHKKFYDIHIVLEGGEMVEVCPIDRLTNVTPYVEDIYFGDYAGADVFSGELQPGYFLVCFPQDAHKVGCHLDNTEAKAVKKIVCKLKV